MAHPVLARKWRPQTFVDVSGQKHVVRALSNALIQQRLHHAYLLTGTRGVGKTSLARILAKCLNCEKGVTPDPCLTCSACQAIEKNQFIDLIEIDAASRSRVEDIRDLLENVQYMPTIGRYKVYLIDEVHMLSNHSFNALLKTLEEPPAHVIFILATTEPDRLPITILSRCLQFQLKAMTAEQIIQRLAFILQDEKLAFTETALAIIAEAAQGSMRDALSLLDQVIALGAGEVTEKAALDLLGGISTEAILQLIQHINENQGSAVLKMIQQWLFEGVDFQLTLDALINNLHQISILQVIPEAPSFDSAHLIRQKLAQQIDKEILQLYYQIALHGKRDLPYAPTPRLGFEMTLLRMLAFIPATEVVVPTKPLLTEKEVNLLPQISPPVITPFVPQEKILAPEPVSTALLEWHKIVPALELKGPSKVLAEYCILKSYQDDTLTLLLEAGQKPMLTALSQEKLTEALNRYFGKSLCVRIEIGQAGLPCLANLCKQKEIAEQEQATQALLQDPNLQSLLHQFDASIEPGSIQSTLTEESSNETKF